MQSSGGLFYARPCAAQAFLCSGSSALLMALVRLEPRFWPLAFVALVPLLRYAVRAKPARSAIAGAISALCYSIIVLDNPAFIFSRPFVIESTVLVLMLSLFGFIVSKAAGRFGFSALLTALVWVPAAYVLETSSNVGDVLVPAPTDSWLLFRVSSVLGGLVVSFLIVLVNSVLTVISNRTGKPACSENRCGKEKATRSTQGRDRVWVTGERYLRADPRAPPRCTHVLRLALCSGGA